MRLDSGPRQSWKQLPNRRAWNATSGPIPQEHGTQDHIRIYIYMRNSWGYRSLYIQSILLLHLYHYLFSITIVKSQITQAQGFYYGHFPPSAWLYGAADLCLRKLGWSEEPWQNDRHGFFWALEQWNNGGSMVDSRLMVVNSD